MLKKLLVYLIALTFSYALDVNSSIWQKGETFLSYLEANQIPQKTYYGIDDEDTQDLARMIFAGTRFFEARDEAGVLHYSLIPVSEDVGILLKRQADASYSFEAVELDYEIYKESVSFKLQSSVLQDLKKISGNSKLATEMSDVFNDIVDFRKDLQKDDQISIIYERKIRLGQTWGMPLVLAAFMENNKKKKYAFYNPKDEGYYDENAKPLKGMFLKYPMEFTRISSPFSRGRMHPILHTIRPHYGIDYVAKIGTPVKSVADGTVVYVGTKGGYGKAVIIQHKNGWRTIYAHLNGYAKISRGKRVRQGQLIAFMGNTGLSTGPHLHFGVYKKNDPFNPARLKSIKKDGLSGKAKQEYLAASSDLKLRLLEISTQKLDEIVRLALLKQPASKSY
ncbi:MAG: peptidoglycan DD-metalloendopeptidase family protein [Helicobacteraceae bacterium]